MDNWTLWRKKDAIQFVFLALIIVLGYKYYFLKILRFKLLFSCQFGSKYQSKLNNFPEILAIIPLSNAVDVKKEAFGDDNLYLIFISFKIVLIWIGIKEDRDILEYSTLIKDVADSIVLCKNLRILYFEL